MKSDDARGARGTSGTEGEGGRPDVPRPPVPRPAGPPPAAPPMPIGAPRAGSRRPAEAGRASRDRSVDRAVAERPAPRRRARRLAVRTCAARRRAAAAPSLLGPLLALVLWLVIWALLADFRIPYVKVPLEAVTPGSWWFFDTLRAGSVPAAAYSIETLYHQLLVLLAGLWAARVGNWAGLVRYWAGPRLERVRLMLSGFGALLALWLIWTQKVPLLDVFFYWVRGWLFSGNQLLATLAAYGSYALAVAVVVLPFGRAGHWGAALRGLRARRAATGSQGADSPSPATTTGTEAATWPELRAAGLADAAEVLTSAVRAGRMNDVDCVRVNRAWERARTRHDGPVSFGETVVRRGRTPSCTPRGAGTSRSGPHATTCCSARSASAAARTTNAIRTRAGARGRHWTPPSWARPCWRSARPARARRRGWCVRSWRVWRFRP